MSEPSPPMRAGWYHDPFGRFAARYFDGQSWTVDIRDHNGRTGSDPQAPPSGAVPQPAPAPAQAGPSGGGIPTGLLLATGGLILVALSLFVFDWLTSVRTGRGVRLHDLTPTLPGGRSDYEQLGAFGQAYIEYVGLLLMLGVALAALVATWPTPSGRRPRRQRWFGASLALVAAGVHLVVIALVANAYTAYGVVELAAGGWIGLVGYGLVFVASVVGSGRSAKPQPKPR